MFINTYNDKSSFARALLLLWIKRPVMEDKKSSVAEVTSLMGVFHECKPQEITAKQYMQENL